MKLKIIITLTLIVTFFVFRPLLFAEQISLDNGAITFDVPAGFTKLTTEEIQFKFPSANVPRFAVGNQDRTVTIICALSGLGMPPDKLTDAELPYFQAEMAQAFSRKIQGIKWIKNEITDINGKKWILFEMTSSAVGEDVHNIMLVTFFRGQMLNVNFNSTLSAFHEVEADLKRCIQSMIVKK